MIAAVSTYLDSSKKSYGKIPKRLTLVWGEHVPIHTEEQKKILVVDNNRVMVKLMTTFLEREGHEVVGVEDAFDALDALRSFTPQIIYLDLIMPKIGGDNLCKIFRTIPQLDNCYIAIISATAMEQPIDISRLGADACIAKGPFAKMTHHILETIAESSGHRKIPVKSEVRGIENLISRQITKELLRQNKCLQTILESISQGVLITTDNRVFYANAATLSLLQVTMERLLGSYLDEILDPACWEMLVPFIRFDGAGIPNDTDDTYIKIHDRHVIPKCLTMQGDNNNQIILLTDITDIKQTQRELLQEEERWKTTFDAMADPVSLVMSDGTIERCNQAFAALLGNDIATLQGKKCYELIHRTKTFIKGCPLIRTRKSNVREQMELSLGENIYLITVDPLKSHDGQVSGFIQIMRDITEQKHAAAVSRRFELLVTHNRDIIFFIRYDDLRIMEVNEAAIKAYGYSREQLLSMTVDQLRTPDTLEMVPGQMEKAYKFGILFEAVHCCSDGSTFPVEVSSRGESIDGTRTLISVVRDITERKRAEEALMHSEERLSQIARCVPDLIWTMDFSGRFTYVNSAVERFYGWTVEEFLNLTFHDTVTPQQALKVEAMISEELAKTTALNYDRNWVRTFESEKIRKDGSILLAEVSATLLWSDDGKPTGIIGTTRDITERKREEEEKLQLQGQLLHAQKMETVGRLAGGVAHDFNNMLSVILGHIELALTQCSPSEAIYSDLKTIQDSALRSADLTRQLLAFARKQTVAPKILDLNDIVSSMLKMLKRLIGEDIELAWYPCAGRLLAKIDPSQLDQLLVNLCVNSRDAIAGVGKVTIETGKEVFDKDYCSVHSDFLPGEYVMLAVSDNGSGMDSETCEHLFEPFFSTKETGKGTGLGLSTVYGIVRQNDGFIHVDSEIGRGTTFKIFLPNQAGEQESIHRDGELKQEIYGNETILLVEDEPRILSMIEKMLKPRGYTILPAATPGEAIRLANDHTGEIHLLITDVVMPNINGYELAKRILSIYPNLRCLFMSGYTANVIAHHGVLDEGVHFIEKPFAMKQLTSKIREVLDFV